MESFPIKLQSFKKNRGLNYWQKSHFFVIFTLPCFIIFIDKWSWLGLWFDFAQKPRALARVSFITVCSKDRKNIFGKKLNHQSYSVGTALAAVRNNIQNQNNIAIELTELGQIIKQQLTKIESNHKNLILDTYTIMPNHIHMILVIRNDNILNRTLNRTAARAVPTISDIICIIGLKSG